MEANHPHVTTQKSLYVEISRVRETTGLELWMDVELCGEWKLNRKQEF